MLDKDTLEAFKKVGPNGHRYGGRQGGYNAFSGLGIVKNSKEEQGAHISDEASNEILRGNIYRGLWTTFTTHKDTVK